MSIDVKENVNVLSPYKPRKMAVGEVDYMEAIPEDFMKTVVFLCVDESIDGVTKRIPKATGFFVRVPVEDSTDISIDYLVTAGHCINEARKYGILHIRVNHKAGKFIEFPTKVDDWYTHVNADVAVIPLLHDALPSGVQSTDLDVTSLDINTFVGGAPDYKRIVTRYNQQHEIRPRVGHGVYFVGLFTEHYGEERNLPIARFGNISRMPELITMESHGIVSSTIAYLVEFHSLGGHSGSPVFYLIPTTVEHHAALRLADGNILSLPQRIDLSWETSFMGLISGHYPIVEKAQTTGDILGEVQIAQNSGIATITPAIAVTDLLMREDFVEYRKEIKKTAESKRSFPTLDMAKTEEEFTQDDFLQDLRKVSQKKSGEEQS